MHSSTPDFGPFTYEGGGSGSRDLIRALVVTKTSGRVGPMVGVVESVELLI